MIPEFGKFPDLIDRKDFSVFEIISFAPFVNPFFRLEEKHGRSGEESGHRTSGRRAEGSELTMCLRRRPRRRERRLSNFAIFDFQLNRLIALRANGFDDRIDCEARRGCRACPRRSWRNRSYRLHGL